MEKSRVMQGICKKFTNGSSGNGCVFRGVVSELETFNMKIFAKVIS